MPNLSLGDGFYLLHKTLAGDAPPVVVEVPTDHVVIIDCSGSMYHELPQIRQQLKNKLPMMMRENDSISIVWFSGRTQYGVVVENVAMRTAVDLSGVQRAIDQYLRPIGLTGFVEPLKETQKLIGRLRKPGRAVNLFFMTDGYDNQWKKEEILHETAQLQDMVSSAAIVEYGYYCNKPLMVQMAERLGATEVLAESFSQYEPIFGASITKKALGTKKIEVNIDSRPLHGFAFSIDTGEVVTFAVDGKSVLVPEGTRDLYWFADMPPSANFMFPSQIMETKKNPTGTEMQGALYAGLVPLTQRMLSNDIFKVLKVLGDVKMIRQFANCFGKQSYTSFQEVVTGAAFDEKLRHVDGYNPKEVPAEDAYTIIDLLYELASDDENLFYPSHEAFGYQRTGRKALQADRVLSDDEQAKVAEIAGKLATIRDPAAVQKLQEELSALVSAKPEGLTFEADNPDAGYAVSNLVLNEDRPNISAQVTIPGTVDLTNVIAGLDSTLDATLQASINPETFPFRFPTKIVRNYTIVRDGIRNVKVLPVSLSKKSHAVLHKNGVIADHWHPDNIYEIDLMAIPLINRKMVQAVSAKTMFLRQYDLLKTKAAQKVYNDSFKAKFPSLATKGITDLYGADAAAWLSELGLRDYGFAPKTKLAEATESYYGKELEVKIAKMATLPAVNKVAEKMDKIKADKKGVLTPSEALMAPFIEEVRGFEKSATPEQLKTWLTRRKVDTISAVRKTMRDLSEIKFSIIVGQVWIFPSLDENTLTLSIDGNDVVFTANLNEVEIKV